MTHVMFDLETFGTKPGSVIRSIGACTFSPETGEIGEKFYRNIDHASCEAIGLVVDPGTRQWWSKQSAEAQAVFNENPRPFPEAATAFHSWFKENDGVEIWCQGANFDSVLWEAAVGRAWPSKNFIPWKFWNVRDTRTVYQIADLDTSKIVRVGTYHNAIDDAVYQAICVSRAIQKLRFA